MRKFFKWTFLLLLLGGGGFATWFFFIYSVEEREVFDFVPKDAVYVVDAADPIENWQSFSSTEPWKHLKQHDLFADITSSADYLDSLIQNNKTLFELAGGKRLLISTHLISATDYDFLYLMDLKQAGKAGLLVDALIAVMKKIGYDMTKGELNGETLYTIGSGADAVYLSFVQSIMICSFNKDIISKSIDQSKDPYFSKDADFMQMVSKTPKSGQCRLYLNYAQLEKFLRVYMTSVPETARNFGKILTYTTLDAEVDDKGAKLDGYTQPKDSVASMVSALRNVEGHELMAPEILPANTTFFLSISFDSFDDFYGNLEQGMKLDPAEWDEMEKNRKTTEKLLKISFQENLFSWIGNEVTLGVVPTDLTGAHQAYVGIFHAPDVEKAYNNLELVAKRIKHRTPVKFKEEEYKHHIIRYMEMKGFFKLFFGKLFNKFDHPHFAQIDRYVVFANDTVALHRMIDRHLDKQTLAWDAEFQDFRDHFRKSSNYFLFLNSKFLYPWLPEFGNLETARGIKKNKQYITCFPMAGMQMSAESGRYATQIYFSFMKPAPEVEVPMEPGAKDGGPRPDSLAGIFLEEPTSPE